MSLLKDRTTPTPPSKVTISFTATSGSDITDDLLKTCTNLFNANYGIWGSSAATISKYTRLGQEQVKMSDSRLRPQCLSLPEKTVLVTCSWTDGTMGTQLIGHAFATVWDYSPSNANHTSDFIGWVTQLIVDKFFRKRYIATQLLQTLKSHSLFVSVVSVGLVSSESHPTACNPLYVINDHAEGILASSSISYLKAAELRGNLFQADCDSGAVSSVFTSFYVDHVEPLEALE
ncbi:hypothetical protein K503DRAFT_750862 [Rhizopogon vinicolor AM-OR11-026]|uniref:N-acetyltransferase domain-containing protein n=1 Tax=Rhizopogon vinicolor AM-OR11-026 TaxID=1314800 RepID=A0A1B7MET6_9AGAM|nr:hypothetical protein K503DRAFT_750862 [Rhizopogon vinicolor AM-OR11-026]